MSLPSYLAVGILCGLLCGIDAGVVAGGLPYLRAAEGFSDSVLSMVAGAMTGGVLLSMLVGGWLADRMGRLRLIFAGALLHLAGALVVQLAGMTAVGFVLGRVVQGCGIGCVSVTTPAYLAEAFPTACRGRGVSSFQFSMTAGIVLGAVASWSVAFFFGVPGTLEGSAARCGWRLIFAASSVCSFALVVLCRLLPCGSDMGKEASKAPALRSGLDPRMILLVVLVGLCTSLTGIGLVLDYSVLLLDRVGFSGLDANLVDFLVKCANFAATLVAMTLVDRVGRRPLLFTGLVGCAVSMLGLGLCNWAVGRFALSGNPVIGIVVSMLFVLTVFFFATGPGVISWLVLAEAVPVRFRVRGLAIGSVANCAGAFCLLTGFFPLVGAFGTLPVFALVAGVTLALCAIIHRLLPETRGVEV